MARPKRRMVPHDGRRSSRIGGENLIYIIQTGINIYLKHFAFFFLLSQGLFFAGGNAVVQLRVADLSHSLLD